MPTKKKKIAAGSSGSVSSRSTAKSTVKSRMTSSSSVGESKGDNDSSVMPESLPMEKLVQMGLVDLRATRPPRPQQGAATTGDDNSNALVKQQNKVKYQELVNSKDLQDEGNVALFRM